MPSHRGQTAKAHPTPELSSDRSSSGQTATARAQRSKGSSVAGRWAHRLTSGPGDPVFEFAVRVRRVGLAIEAKTVRWRGRTRRLPETSDPKRQSLRVEGYPVVARVVPATTVLEEHQRLLCELDEQFEALGVERFLIPEGDGFFRIGVPGGLRRTVTECIHNLVAREDLLVSEIDPNRPRAYRKFHDIDASRRPSNGLRVWSPVVAADRTSVLSRRSGVTIEFWQRGKDDALNAPSKNRYGPTLPRSVTAHSGRVVVRERSMKTFEDLARPHISDFTFPIDLVYTWVDGSDPAWQERRREAQRRYSLPVSPASVDDSRFRDLSELRYSLRSAFAHVPWFRHAWIVVDDQVPSWFKDHPRVTFVSHREIWDDPEQLPVFNSHAMESRLPHIPGLAEQYVYLNDDFFFGRPLRPSFFFTVGGLAKFFPSTVRIGLGEQSIGEPPGSAAAKNDRAALLDVFNSLQTRRLKHIPYPQRKSVALEVERTFPDLYSATAGSVFRSTSDISPVALQSWFAYRTGKAVAAKSKYAYVDVSDASHIGRLDELAKHEVDTFCLNQTEHNTVDPATIAQNMQTFLEKEFPFRGPWER